MKVVVLCGGKGTRLREETEYRPKPMLPIGTRPILWHIMKIYAAHGHTDFILCLGYKGDIIKEYFRNYRWQGGDVSLSLGDYASCDFHGTNSEGNWKVTLAETGENSMTAFRVKLIEKYLGEDTQFLLTYGDGVGDIDVGASIQQHNAQKKICTLSATRPPGRFGELSLSADSSVLSFNEKPQTEGGYINGGFMVCEREIFRYLPNDPSMMLEQAPLKELAAAGMLGAYRHDGFWQPMDTFQEFTLLNKMWESGNAPWRIWE